MQNETEKVKVERKPRRRISLGPVWTANVLKGQVSDHEKLVYHGVKLKIGAKSDLKVWPFESLLKSVQEKLQQVMA